MKVVFPESIVERCVCLEAPGASFHRVMIAIPAVVKCGETFAATISLLDANALPISSDGQELEICVGDRTCGRLRFRDGGVALCCVENLVQHTDGFFRLKAIFNDQAFVSNPSLATDDDVPRLYWGDPHIHTTVGDCHPERCRTRNLAYSAARYAYGLDFVAIADHVSWAPRGTAGKWYDNLAACELFDEPGCFSTLYCYETSMRGGRGGDCNIYLKKPVRKYVDPWPDDLNIVGLCEQIDGEFIAIPHHTTRTGKHGEIPPDAYPGERMLPVVEIHSKWGTSEYRGNPTPLCDVHSGPSYVQDLLAQGYRLGFVGGTDSHTSLTFCRWLEADVHQAQPGLTAVMTKENCRGAIWEAIQSRRCYAACGERIWLDVKIEGLDMGQVGAMPASGKITIRAKYAAESVISRVDIVCNGHVIHQIAPDDWKGQFAWTDADAALREPIRDFASGTPMLYYYVRISAQADARAWSSPCWLSETT